MKEIFGMGNVGTGHDEIPRSEAQSGSQAVNKKDGVRLVQDRNSDLSENSMVLLPI